MKILLAIKSCRQHYLEGFHEPILKTYARDLPSNVDLKFFMGYTGEGSVVPISGEIVLSCADDYDSLPQKTKKIAEYSVLADYDFTFLADTDTFLVPRKLLSCGFENYDIAGRFGNMPALGTTFNYRDPRGVYPNCHVWPSGGIGYFLSRKAAKIIAGAPITVWAEDMQIGQTLGPLIQSGEIKAYDIPEFECNASWHFPRRSFNQKVYSPEVGWMEKMYAEHK